MLDAFCDRSRRAKCSKQECPSWGNLFAQNVVDGSALPVHVTGPDTAPTCPEPPDRHRVVHRIDAAGRLPAKPSSQKIGPMLSERCAAD